MGDIRYKLNERLGTLRLSANEDAGWVQDGADPSSPRFERASRNISEQRTIEATLATMQLADAQREVARAQREVAEEQRKANVAQAERQSASEEIAFWSRRYATGLTVAHAAGLVATLAFLTKGDSPVVPLSDVIPTFWMFALGLALGGMHPLLKILSLLTKGAKRFWTVVDWTWLAATFFLLGGAITGAAGTSLEAYAARQPASPLEVNANQG
tara:strand:- start:71 stop:712 length:642 start_codon:yes stop_codon:yes gene_type:complete